MGFRAVAILGLLATFLQMQLPLIMADCPLDLSGSNFTLAAALCSNLTERGKCCRYINAFVAVAVARYSNVTGDLGVASDSSDACLSSISDTLNLHGVPHNAIRSFAALASQVDNSSAAAFASCFFRVPGHSTIVSTRTSSPQTPKASTSPPVASPSELSLGAPLNESHKRSHLTLIPVIGIAVTAVAFTLLVVLIFVIYRKRKELEDSEGNVKTSLGANPRPPHPILKIQEGPSSILRKFTYKETKKATNNFSTVIGQGGFGTVYKAEFSDGLVAAVKRMDKVSEQAEVEFCREIELLARLHHRHLVALKGFSTEDRN